jgi:tellurite resistance protein TehA-like permease
MRGPLAAAVVFAALGVSSGLVARRNYRRRLAAHPGKAEDLKARMQSSIAGFTIGMFVAFGSVLRMAGYEASLARYAAVTLYCLAVTFGSLATAFLIVKVRFRDITVSEALDFPSMTSRGMKALAIIALLVGLTMMGIGFTIGEDLGWLIS